MLHFRAVQTGAVVSSPPLSEVQAAQCEATACAIGFLLRVCVCMCVCVNCAGHALMVGAPGCELAAAEEDRDKFLFFHVTKGATDMTCNARCNRNTKQQVVYSVRLCGVYVLLIIHPRVIYLCDW